MRFVIHLHSGKSSRDDHVDFMIEMKTGLATWRIPVDGLEKLRNGEIVKALKIDEHRKEYLSYEGPISCDRGMVKIKDTGECKTIPTDSDIEYYVLSGKDLKGCLEVTHVSGNRYLFHYGQESF